MAIVFTNAGEAIALRNIVNNTPPQTLVIKLYSNNRTPTKLDTPFYRKEYIQPNIECEILPIVSKMNLKFNLIEGDYKSLRKITTINDL